MVTNWTLDARIVEIIDDYPIMKDTGLELTMDNIRLGKDGL